MQERLQKLIAQAGIASRRAAEEMIKAGDVSVNGEIITELGTKADPSKDHIKVRGKLINRKLEAPSGRLARLRSEGRGAWPIVAEFYLRALGRPQV